MHLRIPIPIRVWVVGVFSGTAMSMSAQANLICDPQNPDGLYACFGGFLQQLPGSPNFYDRSFGQVTLIPENNRVEVVASSFEWGVSNVAMHDLATGIAYEPRDLPGQFVFDPLPQGVYEVRVSGEWWTSQPVSYYEVAVYPLPPIPEPATYVLLLAGLAALVAYSQWQKRSRRGDAPRRHLETAGMNRHTIAGPAVVLLVTFSGFVGTARAEAVDCVEPTGPLQYCYGDTLNLRAPTFYGWTLGDMLLTPGTTSNVVGSLDLTNASVSSIRLVRVDGVQPDAVDADVSNGVSFNDLTGGQYQLRVSGTLDYEIEGIHYGGIFARMTVIPAIPEPETYALMLAGLLVVAVAAQRRGRGT